MEHSEKMVAMQAKLIEQARAGDPLAQKNLGEMRISWKEDDTNADVMEIAESLTDPGTQAEMASILKGTVVLPEPVGTPVRAVEVGDFGENCCGETGQSTRKIRRNQKTKRGWSRFRFYPEQRFKFCNSRWQKENC